MDRKRLKFIALFGGILLSMALLLAVAARSPGGFVYYVTVTEFRQLETHEPPGFRVNGKVVPGSIERLPTGQDVTFMMADAASSLAVSFHGEIPDTFVDDADVVVEGELGSDGTFHAHTLLAKCPSKYEAADN